MSRLFGLAFMADWDCARETRAEIEQEDAGVEQDGLERERDLAAPWSFELDSYKDKPRAA